MRLIKIEKLENGGHINQTIDKLSKIPEGYAIIPDDMETENFPYGDLTTEEINGVVTVTSWTPGEIPEPGPEPGLKPSTDQVLNTLLGVNE